MTISWPLSRQQVLDADGRPYLPAYAGFFEGGTTTPLTVYADPGLTVPLPSPVVTDGTGRFPRVYLPAGLYAEEVKGPYGDVLWFDDDLGEAVPSTVVEPTPTLDPRGVASILLTVTPRDPRHRCWGGWWSCGSSEPVPVLTAALSTGALDASNPGILEAVFPAGSLLAFPPGLYDARVIVTIGPETEEIFREPIEFA